MATFGRTLRRGLPRRPGGEPWPPAGDAPLAAGVADAPAEASASVVAAAPAQTPASVPAAAATPTSAPASEHAAVATASAPASHAAAAPVAAPGAVLRRGLPRDASGEPWPPAGTVAPAPVVAAPAAAAPESSSAPVSSAPVSADIVSAEPLPAAPVAAPATTAPAPAEIAVPAGPRPPLTVPRTVWPGRAATVRPAPLPEPVRIGPFTRGQWLGAVVVGGAGLLIAAGMAVAVVRVILSMPFGQEFLAAFPGEYHLPEGAPVGFPAWLGWQHFFNVFLMVLIIRTGLTIRAEKRPSVFWTPRRDPKGKTSLTIWFHQSLDVLWLANGVVFVVLLFVTGQWMRIVPTSWEVFPNALSAALQYVSLDWPTENGWVNYNSLQQLAYFATVFLAAPLAAITGYRMSNFWPKNNARLTKAYPVEWARRIHFPVMLYFVVFIFIHVALVFATGALRNLNHMYAAQGSVDGVAFADNWTGFWMFAASLVVIAAAWVAARPLTLAPIARLFGTVSGR